MQHRSGDRHAEDGAGGVMQHIADVVVGCCRGVDRRLAPVGDNRRRRSARWASADDRVRQTRAVSVTGNEAEEAADLSGAGSDSDAQWLFTGVSDFVGSHTAAGCSVATAQVAGCGVVAELGSGAAGERRREILEMNGSAVLLSSWALVGEQDVVAMFQAARDSEYEEIPDKCRDFTQGWTRSRRQIISPTVRSRRTRSSW
jgi:hypothetical protein